MPSVHVWQVGDEHLTAIAFALFCSLESSSLQELEIQEMEQDGDLPRDAIALGEGPGDSAADVRPRRTNHLIEFLAKILSASPQEALLACKSLQKLCHTCSMGFTARQPWLIQEVQHCINLNVLVMMQLSCWSRAGKQVLF